MKVSALTPSSGERVDRVRGLRPNLVDAVAENYSMLETMVDARCVELCRLRIAQILGDDEQFRSGHAGVSVAQRDELANWRTSSLFSRKERACLEFAEQFLYSADAVTDEQVEALDEFFQPDEIWALTNAIAVTERFGRLAAFFETVDAKEAK